jgi:hypothetical protein
LIQKGEGKEEEKDNRIPVESPTLCNHAPQHTTYENPLSIQLESAFLGEIKLSRN